MNRGLYKTINIRNGKRIGAIFKSFKEIEYIVSDFYDKRSENETMNRFIIETNKLKEEGYNPLIAYSNINEDSVKKIREFVNPNQKKRKTIMSEEEIKDLTNRLRT